MRLDTVELSGVTRHPYVIIRRIVFMPAAVTPCILIVKWIVSAILIIFEGRVHESHSLTLDELSCGLGTLFRLIFFHNRLTFTWLSVSVCHDSSLLVIMLRPSVDLIDELLQCVTSMLL